VVWSTLIINTAPNYGRNLEETGANPPAIIVLTA
jgi:hypothetical protein